MAEKISERLAPFCDRIQVAGSIRRGKEVVNDIDIVCLPKSHQEENFRSRCIQRGTVVTNAAQTIVVVLENKVQLDIWIATPASSDFFEEKPCNFGSLLLMRTGSRLHNIHLVKTAKDQGLTWNPYWGVFDCTGRRCIAADSEEDIFRALGLPFIPPENRER